MVTAFEGAVLYTLCCKRTESVQPIGAGDVYLICSLGAYSIFCEKYEVISTKPFRLKEVGENCGECLSLAADARRTPMRSVLPSYQAHGDFRADSPNYSQMETIR